MPLRRTLLYLSGHSALRRWMETSPVARRLSSRFIAGSTLDEALAACAKIRREGIAATLDYLGENVRTLDEAGLCRDVYLSMLKALHAAGLEPNVSLKLTQFGLDFSTAACEDNVAKLVELAASIGGFVRIDMESSQYTDRTLGIVTRLHSRFGACGTVIQSYLLRIFPGLGRGRGVHGRSAVAAGGRAALAGGMPGHGGGFGRQPERLRRSGSCLALPA